MREIAKAEVELTKAERVVVLIEQIKYYDLMGGECLYNIGVKLREIKTDKLYLENGYDSYDSFTKAVFGYSQRQAYTYISVVENLGQDYIEERARLGISKLSLLASATLGEREQLEGKVDLAEASVSEIEKALKEIADLKKQLSFLEEENMELQNAAESIEIANSSAEAVQGISEEEMKERIAKAEEEARANALQGYAGNIKALEIEKKEAERQRAEIVEKAKSLEQELELEKKQVKLDPELQGALDRLKEEKEKLEKQLKISSNPVMTEFKFMLKNLQDEFNQVQSFASASEEKDKMLMALKKVVQSLADKIQI